MIGQVLTFFQMTWVFFLVETLFNEFHPNCYNLAITEFTDAIVKEKKNIESALQATSKQTLWFFFKSLDAQKVCIRMY